MYTSRHNIEEGIVEIKDIIKKKLIAIIILGVIMGVAFGTMLWSINSPKYIVEISINPKIELKGNVHGRIIEFKGSDELGDEILRDLSLKGEGIEDGVILVVESMKDLNLLEQNNELTINITGGSESRNEELILNLKGRLDDFLLREGIETTYKINRL